MASSVSPNAPNEANRSASVQTQIRAYLESHFARDPNPGPAAIQMMATHCGQTKEAIGVWFAARRNLRMPGAEGSVVKPAIDKQIDVSSPFGLISLKIGDWQHNAQYRGEVAGQFDFERQRIMWIILIEGIAQRIEMPFDSVVALELSATSRTTARIIFRFGSMPAFSEELDPSVSKYTVWKTIPDFSGNRVASVNFTHILIATKTEVEFHLRTLLQFSPAIKAMVSQGINRQQTPHTPSTEMNHT